MTQILVSTVSEDHSIPVDVNKPDGTRETIKVQVDKNGNEINE